MDNKARLIPFVNMKSTAPKDILYNDEDIYDDMMIKIKELVNNKAEEQLSNQMKGTPHIIELERKCECMKIKLENCIPYHTIVYLCGNALVFGIALTLLILNLFFNIRVIAVYYIICTIIISLGLFFTALTSLKDWKEFAKDVK